MYELVIAFSTIFALLGLGYLIQRVRPLTPQGLTDISQLLIQVLLPLFLFSNTAQTSLEQLRVAPRLILMGITVALLAFTLATLTSKPAKVDDDRQPTYRFSTMLANTGFLGLPLCTTLFGSTGAVYAVLYDFGGSLTVFTVGIWALQGGQITNWRPLIMNPLLWGVLGGLAWAGLGIPKWEVLFTPLDTLGQATLTMALLVGGAQLGNLHSPGFAWTRQLSMLSINRLVLIPLIIASIVVLLFRWEDTAASVIMMQAAMPTGLTATVFARNYGGDPEFGAAATLWTTVGAIVSLPIVALLIQGYV